MGADRLEDRRCRNDPAHPENPDHDKPQQHQGPEDVADERSALALHQKQANQDYDAERDDNRRQPGRVDFEAFDRAQHRDGRRDDAVAVKQRRADQTDDQKGGAPDAVRCAPQVEQRQQRHDAAFTVVVGAHDQDRVFERDDHDQCPQDQRRHTQDGFG